MVLQPRRGSGERHQPLVEQQLGLLLQLDGAGEELLPGQPLHGVGRGDGADGKEHAPDAAGERRVDEQLDRVRGKDDEDTVERLQTKFGDEEPGIGAEGKPHRGTEAAPGRGPAGGRERRTRRLAALSHRRPLPA